MACLLSMGEIFDVLFGACIMLGGNLYISLFDRGVLALALSEHLPQRYEFVGHYTFLCLCSTTGGLCAGAYDGLVYLFSPKLERLRVFYMA